MAKIEFPNGRIFSQTISGTPKTEVLKLLQEKHPNASSMHFIEDKVSTLNKVIFSIEWYLIKVMWQGG